MAKNSAKKKKNKNAAEVSSKTAAPRPATPRPRSSKITTSSTAEYFSKNLQQVGFSSMNKAVLTTLKESVDNSLDACDTNGILPELKVRIERKGSGTLRGSERIYVRVEDNGPGIDPEDVPKVFGEYLASSKFGRGRCSRGQQGIGISAATTWAQLTNARGAKVTTKTAKMRKAMKCVVEVDIKNNRGLIKEKETIEWSKTHGTIVEFIIDGRLQFKGEGGLETYLTGCTLVNPHLTLHYHLADQEKVKIERVSEDIPEIPAATDPHPHTMKLGEFIAHGHLFGHMRVGKWLKKAFSRISDSVLQDLVKAGVNKKLIDQWVDKVNDADLKDVYSKLQQMELRPPTTRSVLSIGEDSLAKSIRRFGDTDFFSVVTRRPRICDFKPVQIEVAVARLEAKRKSEDEGPVQILRFANRVPLQFDKSACAIVQSLTSVNWRAYGLAQPRNGLPMGNYIIAVSVVSPFIKFKNASKETIDASEELVEEIRRALIQAGQRLGRHIRRESKAAELEKRVRHIEQFGPVLVSGLVRITGAAQSREAKAEIGLLKILGRDAKASEAELQEAHDHLEKQRIRLVKQGREAIAGGIGDTLVSTEEPKPVKKTKAKSKVVKSPANKKSKPKAKKKQK